MNPSGVVVDVMDLVDAAVQGPALVMGEGPPAAPVLRVLLRSADAPAVEARLAAAGFLRRGATWARFDRSEVRAVELHSAETWGASGTGEELFVGGLPVPGFDHLARPAPHVVLVLAAHDLLLADRTLSDDQRKRALAAASSGPGVWDDAVALAAQYRLSAAVQSLRRALGRPGRGAVRQRQSRVVRELARHRRRPVLVSLSGPDGSGKSTQVGCLAATLETLGLRTGTAWVPTTQRPTLPTSIRTWAAGWRRPVAGDPVREETASSGDEPRPDGPRSAPAHVRLVEHLWITSAAVSNAAKIWWSVWRGRGNEVLVLDRFVLDADVKLTFWYSLRRGADITLERRLFRAISPKVDVSVLLAVAPETNHARRADEWRLGAFRHFHRIYAETARELGAVVVDAERPVGDVARDVAETVWTRLP